MIKDQYRKMTETPIPRLIISLGVPTTISMLVTNIYNLADTYFVGRLGTSASGAIGIVFGLMSIIQAIGFMLGQGAGALLSRKLGQRDEKSACIYASTSFFTAFAVGIVLSIACFSFLERLLICLGSTETILPFAKRYTTYILFASPLMMCCFVMNNILRFEGKAALAMIGLVSGGVLNMIGDPIFMFVFNMGIDGAGLSTALSQLVSFGILLYMFISGKTQSKISFAMVSHEYSKWIDIITTGLPSLVRQGLSSISIMVLNGCARTYGDSAVSAMSIVSRVAFFIFAVCLGLGQGFQPVCAFNFGAKKYMRVRSAFYFTLVFSEIFIALVAITGFIFSPQIIAVFRNDPLVIEKGDLALKLHCVGLLFQPLVVMSNMAFQTTGKRMLAIMSATLRSGLCFIPVLLLMFNIYGLFGVQSAQPISDVLAFLLVLPFILTFINTLKETEQNERKTI